MPAAGRLALQAVLLPGTSCRTNGLAAALLPRYRRSRCPSDSTVRSLRGRFLHPLRSPALCRVEQAANLGPPEEDELPGNERLQSHPHHPMGGQPIKGKPTETSLTSGHSADRPLRRLADESS